MNIAFRTIHLPKRFPLAISRGISADTDNLFVSITRDHVTGWGEMAPGVSQGAATTEIAQDALTEFFASGLEELAIAQIYARARECEVPPCALAALDIALWDGLARKVDTPLYKLFGFNKPSAPTSITIGISTPEVVRERMPLLLDGYGFKALKIKLGSREGIEADQAMFAQVLESTRNYSLALRVDANGGWSVDQALVMHAWLAERGVEYVEQPLAEGCEKDLPALYKNRPLPIFVDESCRFAEDVPALAAAVDGVNLKLMKCGGITEALRIITVARAHGLETMIGCMSESSMSISAAAAITGVIDHIDLDSHLNLDPDPCVGAELIDGVVMPNELPGHGAVFV